jgi:protein gp37
MSTISWLRGEDGTEGKTWNPIRARNKETGKVGWFCVHAGAGCVNCYAEAQNISRGFAGGNGYAYIALNLDKVEIYLDVDVLLRPLTWRKPTRIFPCSMTDLYGEFVKREWIDAIKAVEAAADQHTYIELTKRPHLRKEYLDDPAWYARAAYMLGAVTVASGDGKLDRARLAAVAPAASRLTELQTSMAPMPNVWSVVSCATQRDVDHDVPVLQQTASAVRGVSLEPLLEPADLTRVDLGDRAIPGYGRRRVTWNALTGEETHSSPGRRLARGEYGASAGIAAHRRIHWVVPGFESGDNARMCDVALIRRVIDDCARSTADVACFVKQLGPAYRDGDHVVTLNHKRGEDPAEWPEDLRVRQFPAHPAPRRSAPAAPQQLALADGLA